MLYLQYNYLVDRQVVIYTYYQYFLFVDKLFSDYVTGQLRGISYHHYLIDYPLPRIYLYNKFSLLPY